MENNKGMVLELNRIDDYLRDTLISVEPRKEFVLNLEKKIEDNIGHSRTMSKKAKITIFASAGILSSLIIIITGIKATSGITKIRKQYQEKQAILV